MEYNFLNSYFTPSNIKKEGKFIKCFGDDFAFYFDKNSLNKNILIGNFIFYLNDKFKIIVSLEPFKLINNTTFEDFIDSLNFSINFKFEELNKINLENKFLTFNNFTYNLYIDEDINITRIELIGNNSGDFIIDEFEIIKQELLSLHSNSIKNNHLLWSKSKIMSLDEDVKDYINKFTKENNIEYQLIDYKDFIEIYISKLDYKKLLENRIIKIIIESELEFPLKNNLILQSDSSIEYNSESELIKIQKIDKNKLSLNILSYVVLKGESL